jgi:hypothetical protein
LRDYRKWRSASARRRPLPSTIAGQCAGRQRAGFALGNRVRVCSGPMRGCFGLYAGMAPRDRLLILLQMLGGAREIELPKSDVLKIGTMGV